MSSDGTTFTAPRGMRDFYPEEMVVRNRIFDAWRQAAERHGFQPYDAPVVESLDLLTRKAGEEIVHQIYAFKDKSDRALALRPEMTPTLARMVAARQGLLTFPIKWYAIAQCFRYERMTRGRKREHYQWNLDVIGEPSVAAEAEVIATAVDGMFLLGLRRGEFQVHFSSRRLLSSLLAALGIPPDQHAPTFLALDKRGKVSDDDLTTILSDAGLSPAQRDAVWKLLELSSLDAALALLPADAPVRDELGRFTQMLADYGLSDTVRFDISVVRGLSYYTGIVFEGFDARHELRALFGGGRYDNLLASVGGRPETGVGLGFGDVVIAELLSDLGRLWVDGARGDLAIGYMQEAQRASATRLALRLRDEGRQVDLALRDEKAKQFFARVSKRPFRFAAYLGPDDLQRGTARIKDLESRQETEQAIPQQ